MSAGSIVAGTDGSEESLLAVEWAVREAALHHRPLRLVAVLAPPPRINPALSAAAVTEAAGRRLDRALTAAADLASDAAPGPAVTTELLAGQPARILAEITRDAAMLVVGSRGAGGFAAMILGSVSRYLATHASCPLAVVREETMAVHREIVVGIGDPDPPGPSAALDFAFREAALRQARLLAVHAWYWSLPGSRLDSPDVPAAARQRLTQGLARYRDAYPGVEVSEDVVHAHPGRVLTGASARADLVVLGRHRPGEVGSDVGSVTHAVVSHAHGPVAVIPSG
jgi:nucleotide-binding universal stress UspA family protein